MLPLVVSPIIHNVTVTKMLVDGGAGLNLISAKLLGKLQVPRESLLPTGPFLGVNPGATQPLGKIVLPVTFGTRENYRTENITFDVADIPLPYNGILGRPALAKFMAVTHYAYNMLKIPAEWGPITVKADAKDAMFCIEQIFKLAATSEPATEPGDSPDDDLGSSTPATCSKRARRTPGDDPGETTCVGPAPRQQAMKGDRLLTKKVSLHGDPARCVTIGAHLSEA